MHYISFIVFMIAAHVLLPLSFRVDVSFSLSSARKSGQAHYTTPYELDYGKILPEKEKLY